MVHLAMRCRLRFRVENHAPYLESPYAKAYQEVKDKGANDTTGHTRTPEETATGRFFSDAPGNYWNRLQRDLVVSEELNFGDSARMFALVAMATADAIITCWDTKIHYNVWRPITAIREGDTTAIPKRLATPPGRRSSPPRTILTTPRARTMYRQQRRPFSRTCSATRWRFIRIPRPYRPEPATAMMLPCVR